MMYSDYEKTNLGDEVFDIVILNGSAYFTNHYNVIKEAERITKKNGLLLCCSCGDFLLESIFKLIFTSREEYCLTSSDVILSAQKNGTSWESSLSESHLSKLPVVLQRLKNILLASEENLAPDRQIRQELETLISASMDEYNIPLKVQLINLKEALLNYTSHISTIHKTYFKEELITQISGFSFEGNN